MKRNMKNRTVNSSEKAESAFSKERKPLSVRQKVPSVEKKKIRR
jgi:hypothetical protein